MKVYLANALTGKMKLAIYADNSGVPGSLLKGTNEIINPPVGWNTFNLTSSQSLTSGSYYWLCEWADVAYTTKCEPTGGSARASKITPYGSWPATMPGLNGPYTSKDSIYAQ